MVSTLIFGAGGQLGRELVGIFPDAGMATHNAGDENYVDLKNDASISSRIESESPDLIINAAAMTAVDKCEVDKEAAYLINGVAVKHIINSARKTGAKFIQISTDYVFNGLSGNYSESSIPDPVNYYGMSKLVGDIFVESYENSLIVRTSGVFGTSRNFPSFVYNKLRSSEIVQVIDGYYSPIHAGNLANAIKNLANEGRVGIINVAGERISRYQLSMEISNYFGFDSSVIRNVKTLEKLTAKRPYDSSLDISKAKEILNFDFYSIQSNLKRFAESI